MELAIAVAGIFTTVYIGVFAGTLNTFSNEIRDGFKKLLVKRPRKKLYSQVLYDVLNRPVDFID